MACTDNEQLRKQIEDIKESELYKCLEKERANVRELLDQLKSEKLQVNDLGNRLFNQELDDFLKGLNNLKTQEKSKKDEASVEKCEENMSQIEIENAYLKKKLKDQSDSLSSLAVELEDSRKFILHLNSEIELQQQRESLLIELKLKAEQFEQYITDKRNKNDDRRDVSTSPNKSQNVDLEKYNDELQKKLRIEKQVRQDISQHFALERRKLEAQNGIKLSEMKRELEEDVYQLSNALKVKAKEVETLQDVILVERQKYLETIEKLTYEIEKNKRFEQQLILTQEEAEKIRKKYKVVKKTLSKYKEYMAEKDKHVNCELSRIKKVYENSLQKLKDRLNNFLTQNKYKTEDKMYSSCSEKVAKPD